MHLYRLRDDHWFSSEKIEVIVDCLSRIESLGKGITRYGCPFDSYLDQHEKETYQLPRYLVRIRTGNEEKFEFLFNEDDRSEFYKNYEIMEEDQGDVCIRHLEKRRR